MDLNNRKAAVLASAAASVLLSCANEKKEKSKRLWERKWISRRQEKGLFHVLSKELLLEDQFSFRNFLRMDEDTFRLLLSMVETKIAKQDTRLRKSISPDEKLSATLRFLATGESYQSMEYHTRLSKSFLCYAVPEVCAAVYDALKDEYLKVRNLTIINSITYFIINSSQS